MNKYLGCDVGIRTLLSFSNGGFFHYKFTTEDKLLLKKINSKKKSPTARDALSDNILDKFKVYMLRYCHDVHFIFEDYLLETGYLIPKFLQRKKFVELNIFGDAVDKIRNYLATLGRISYVESRNSSLECHSCGLVDFENRKNIKGFTNNRYFCCVSCDFGIINSDLNAAKVLLKRFFKGEGDVLKND